MEQVLIEKFVKENDDDFREKDLEEIKILLKQADESVIIKIQETTRSPRLWSGLHWIAGEFGVDRFVLGQPMMGIIKLVWFVLFGILGYTVAPYFWGVEFIPWFVDEWTISTRVRKYNYNKVKDILKH